MDWKVHYLHKISGWIRIYVINFSTPLMFPPEVYNLFKTPEFLPCYAPEDIFFTDQQ